MLYARYYGITFYTTLLDFFYRTIGKKKKQSSNGYNITVIAKL